MKRCKLSFCPLLHGEALKQTNILHGLSTGEACSKAESLIQHEEADWIIVYKKTFLTRRWKKIFHWNR